VEFLCGVYGVSRSGYYAWRSRKPSKREMANRELTKEIRRIHDRSRNVYGSPRVQKALRQQGIRVNHKRTERIMREEGIKGRICSVYWRTAGIHRFFDKADNVLRERGGPTGINQVWVGDITFIKLNRKWKYLAIVMDLYSRRVLGWSLGDRRTSGLTSRALRNALKKRTPKPGLVFHSDRGVEYLSCEYYGLLNKYGIVPSMNRPGHCQDNAHMESFIHSLKGELLRGRRFKTGAELANAINGYINFYNSRRLHSGIEYKTPVEYERLVG